jgi:hypothetical protein
VETRAERVDGNDWQEHRQKQGEEKGLGKRIGRAVAENDAE